MAEVIERTAKLFEAGDYPDKELSISTDNLDAIAQSFTAIPVKIEHTDTPLDGAIGNCTKVWREGKDLKGTIGFSPEAWQLIDKAGAKKLSIGIKRDLSALTEVSLVKNPRVASAAVFGDNIEMQGEMVDIVTFASWHGLTSEDIGEQIVKQFNVGGNRYAYIETLGEDYVVVSIEDNIANTTDYLMYDFEVTADKKVSISNKRKVEKQTQWITAEMADNSNHGRTLGGDNMPDEIKSAAPAEGTATFTEEQNALIKSMLQDFGSEVEAKFSGEIARLTAENKALADANKAKDVQFKLDELKRQGKLTPALEPMARVILMSGSQEVQFNDEQTDIASVFMKFVEALPELVKFGEQGKTNGAVAVSMTSEEAKFYEKLTGKKPEEVK